MILLAKFKEYTLFHIPDKFQGDWMTKFFRRSVFDRSLTKTVLCFISDECKAAIDEVPCFFFIWFINRIEMENVPRDIQGEKSRKVTASSGKIKS